ncbi:MAG: TonB-dependent receptor [Melioribacteraceae bacterium]
MQKRVYIFFLFLIMALPLKIILAQGSGSISGRVVDKGTGEPLIGANVLILNTSLGAATDYDGKFTIHHIPVGKRTLQISYIGYETSKLEIDVTTKHLFLGDIQLTPTTFEFEIEVTAQAKGQREAINQQLTSNTIKNVVSAERIRELPDESAAAALSRLPGISLQQGDKIVVRGIQAKQNVVLLNGVQLPSTDMQDRSVNLGFISSNMLSGIEVIKVLTPDMDANALGGVVNLRIMEAPKGFHYDILTRGVYNSQDRTTDNYRFWASVSNRFFNDKLGVFAQAFLDRTNGGSDFTSGGFTILNDKVPFGEAAYKMDSFTFTDQEHIVMNGGGSVILDYLFPQGKIILQNSLSRNINDLADYRTVLNFSQTLATYSLFRDKNNRDLLVNAFLTEYNFGKLKAELNLSHSFTQKKTDLRYGDPGQNFGFDDNYPFGIIGYTSNGNPIARTYTAQSASFTPEDVYKIAIDDSSIYRAKMAGWAVMRWEAFKQNLYTAKLDFTLPVSLTNYINAEFKAGAKFDRSVRKNDVEGAYHRVGDNDMYIGAQGLIPRPANRPLSPTYPLMLNEIMNWDYGKNRGKYFLDGDYPINNVVDKGLMDVFLPKARSGWGLSRHVANSERDDFNGTETFTAGYLMSTLKIGPQLTLIGGIRYEKYDMNYKATFVYVTHSVDGVSLLFDTLNTVKRSDINWFPNIHLQYKITDWADIRLAYSKAISRPDYQAIMPNIYYAPNEQTVFGNPYLKPTVINNYDAAIYLYSNKIGLFTLSGFYKKMKDVFYQSRIYYQNLKYFNANFIDSAAFRAVSIKDLPEPSELITVYLNNPNPGYVRGFEVEWQSNFWYLPKPFNSIVLGINYTRTWSSMEYLRIENTDSTYKQGIFTRHKYKTEVKTYKSRLLYQGDHILNLTLGFDYKGFSGRISYNLQDAVTSSIGTRPEEDAKTGKIPRWDISLKQRLPIEGLSISFNGVNLFRSAVKSYRTFKRPNQTEAVSNLITTSYSPSFYELLLRYEF